MLINLNIKNLKPMFAVFVYHHGITNVKMKASDLILVDPKVQNSPLILAKLKCFPCNNFILESGGPKIYCRYWHSLCIFLTKIFKFKSCLLITKETML